jgi:hypothetical protein
MITEQQHCDRVWTRAHDAVIAEKCEFGKARKERGMPIHLWRWEIPGQTTGWLSRYDSDIHCTIRAAEAWRKQKPGRHYETRSAIADEFGERPENATLFHDLETVASSVYADSALAWALWEAVKDA